MVSTVGVVCMSFFFFLAGVVACADTDAAEMLAEGAGDEAACDVCLEFGEVTAVPCGLETMDPAARRSPGLLPVVSLFFLATG